MIVRHFPRLLICSLAAGCLALLSVERLSAQSSTAVTLPKIVPPAIAGGKQTITLPGTVDDLALGGGGRYLALHFRALGKIAIFDVNQLKIIGEVPGGDADTRFAAGATKLVVSLRNTNVITRYDLATQAKELTQSADLNGQIKWMHLGSGSTGPAIVGTADGQYNAHWHELDLETLRTSKLKLTKNPALFSGTALRIATDGSALTLWEPGLSPMGLNALLRSGDAWTPHSQGNTVGYVVPSPTGKWIYTGEGIFTNQLQRVWTTSRQGEDQELPIPATHGPYYLVAFTSRYRNEKYQGRVTLNFEGEVKPILTIPNVEALTSSGDYWAREPLSLDKRLFLIPDANLILQLAPAGDKLIATHLDIDQALKSSPVDFLVVTSRPPTSLKAGERLNYQIAAKSNSGEIKYALDSGPAGMQLSPTGLLTWTTTTKSPVANQVIVTVNDKKGQQTYHTFSLTVSGGDSTSAASAVVNSVAGTSPAKLLPTTPASFEVEKTVMLPGTVSDVVCGGNGRFLLIHFRELKKVGVFDVSQSKLTGYLPAPDDDTKCVAGATRAVVCSISQGVLTRYRLDTLAAEASAPFADKIQYAGMGSGSEGPLLVHSSKGIDERSTATLQFIDLNTLKPLPVTWPNNRTSSMSFRDRHFIHAATNGAVFSVEQFGVFRLSGNSVQFIGNASYLDRFQGGRPGADGNYYLAGGRLLNSEQLPVGEAKDNFGVGIPAVTGRYFLSFFVNDGRSGRRAGHLQSFKLHLFGESRPLFDIPDVPVSMGNLNEFDADALQWFQRIFFIPDAQVLVTVPGTNDRLALLRVHIDAVLNASGIDYLVVDSTPPPTATLGKPFTYDVKVKSKKGSVKFKLDSGPAGAQLSADGKLTWAVPTTLVEDTQNFVISISDASERSIFHTFAVGIPENKAQAELARKQAQAAAQREAQRQAMEQREAERAAALQRSKELAEQKLKPVMRVWTDGTGEHKLTAKFVEIIDQKTVVLQLENGEIRRIPLSKLSAEDAYEAVRGDLHRQSVNPNKSDSPFGKE